MRAAIAAAKHLHFGGVYLMPQLDGEPTARILKHAQDHGVPVTLDLIAIDRPDLLQILQPAVLEFGRLVQIISTLSLFDLYPGLIDVLPQFAQALHGLSLDLPLRSQCIALGF